MPERKRVPVATVTTSVVFSTKARADISSGLVKTLRSNVDKSRCYFVRDSPWWTNWRASLSLRLLKAASPTLYPVDCFLREILSMEDNNTFKINNCTNEH